MFNLKKIIEYLFYLLVFLLPWQARLIYSKGILNGGHWEYGTASLYATEILLGLLFLLVIILAIFQIKKVGLKPSISKLDYLLLGLLLFSGLSIIWSVNHYVSWQYFLVLIEVVALLYLASRIGWNYIKLSSAFIASGFIQACLAIYQFSTQTVFSSKWLGMSSQLVENGGVSVVEGSGRWLRAYGSLPHPNMLGGFLVIALLFTVGLLFVYQKKYYNPPWKVSGRLFLTAIALFSSLTVITYGILLSFSRSAWLGLLFALCFMWVVLIWKKFKQQLWFFFKINIVILMVIILFISTYGDLLSNRFNMDSRLESQSITERQIGWREAVDIIKDKPLLGVGLGAYTQELYDLDSTREAYAYQPVHNIDLLLMAELGIIGWLVLTTIIVYLLYLLYKKLKLTDDIEVLIIAAAFISLLIIGIFDHYLWSLYFGLLMSFLITGLLIRKIQ